MITADELRKKYLDFFVSKGHAVIPSASLIPENDPTVLFTTAGMHPLVPFLLGEPHPAGKRLVNYQRCIRTSDIDLVGDDTHLTFFEMLGNWSLGDPTSPDGVGRVGYWKKEAIEWSWEFLTEKKWLGLDPERIYVTCFAGDNDAAKDQETAEIWKSVGIPDDHIAFLGKEDNWWGPAGQTGPCGPDTEMFYQVNTDEDEQPKGAHWPKGKYVEIWNDVFMQYNKTADGKYEPLKQKNVDTGMGVERTLAVLNGVKSVFETEVFTNMFEDLPVEKISERSRRITVDHIKAATFLIADGVRPSNKEQGYVLRRLIRKSILELQRNNFDVKVLDSIVIDVIDLYEKPYTIFFVNKDVLGLLAQERDKFLQTLESGLKLLHKARIDGGKIPGKTAFDLYQSFGFPRELIEEEVEINEKEWEEEVEKHKNLSRQGAEKKFKGGLADHSEVVVRMHTATHLLHQALKDVLGNHVAQKGSNITSERLRFDFTHPQKMTKEQIAEVEKIVNMKIMEGIPVEKKVLPIDEARKLGATGLFGEKYGDTVSVYIIGDYSKEFCGGPHVANTKEIGKFTIKKEEAVSAGIRRIKAIVE